MRPWYTVHEDYRGEIIVSSFGGRTKTEERQYALSCSAKVHHIGRDHDEAQKIADELRKTARAAR